MVTTEDFEYLLELPNVRAVEWDGEQLNVRVSKKMSVEDLDPDDNVENQVDVEFTVIDEDEEPDDNAGYDFFNGLEIDKNSDGHKQKHRPVVAGVSEIHNESSAATAGYFKAEVVNVDKGVWSDSIEKGDIVRTSNNHVYNLVGDAELGDDIVQPSPYDGGDHPDDTVGQLAGYVPVENTVTADIAARTISDDEDVTLNIDDGYGSSIFRENFEKLRGETIVKSGRTTGVTTGDIEQVSASVDVNMGENETVTFRDVVITENMGDGGDSGSPAFVRETGEFCCKLFAGSFNSTIFCKVENIENELGIEYISNDYGPPEEKPDEGGVNPICSLLRMLGLDKYLPIC